MIVIAVYLYTVLQTILSINESIFIFFQKVLSKRRLIVALNETMGQNKSKNLHKTINDNNKS